MNDGAEEQDYSTTKVHTKVCIEVEVSEGNFGGNWNVDDVRKSAAKSAVNKLRCALQAKHDMRLVGEPKVTLVLMEDADSRR